MHRNARTFVEKNHVLQKAAAFRSTPRNIAASTSACQQTKNRYLSCCEEQARLKSQAVHHFFDKKRPDGEEDEATDTKHTKMFRRLGHLNTDSAFNTPQTCCVMILRFSKFKFDSFFSFWMYFFLLRRDPWRRERVREFTIFEKRFQSSDWHQSTRKY